MMTTNLQFSEQIVAALSDLHGELDQRNIARYLVNLAARTVPSAERISLHVHFPERDSFVTIGVFGVPHYASTLVTPADSPFGVWQGSRRFIWARTPGEAARVFDVPDDGSITTIRIKQIYGRFSTLNHGSLLIVPCEIGGEFIGTLWADTMSRPRGFSATDRSRLKQIAVLTASLISASSYASIINDSSLIERWDYYRYPRSSQTEPLDNSQHLDTAASVPASHHLVPQPDLSAREMEILHLIDAGYTNQEMADHLIISINTVRTHRRNLMAKFDAHNVADLLAKASPTICPD
ncbi:LuxR C-terminal-related transcriptional regulator [Trueperella pyogenes]|uniref:LuxR C-terminal-related transcriptional regulator n=1 Tax=Trueperella pyogenes TaxID=1661 RepID=UPI00345CF87C